MGGVCGVDLREPEDDRAGQSRQPGIARRRPGARFGRGVERGLGQVFPRLVIDPGLEKEPLVGIARLALFHGVIRIMVDDPRKDLDRLLGNLLAVRLGRILVTGNDHAAATTFESLGLLERPEQGFVAFLCAAGGTAAEAEAGLDRYQVSHLLGVETQERASAWTCPELCAPGRGNL